MQYDGSMGALLDIRDLKIRFGAVEAVRGVNLQVAEGEVLGLVGESGSGKSATALAILGLLGPAARVEGQILWRGSSGAIDLLLQPAEAMRRLRGREIAMIFQEPMTALNPVMTIGRQVAEAARAHSASHSEPWTGRESKRRAIAALEAVAILRCGVVASYGDYTHRNSPAASGRGFSSPYGADQQAQAADCRLSQRSRDTLDVTVQAQVLELLKDLQRPASACRMHLHLARFSSGGPDGQPGGRNASRAGGGDRTLRAIAHPSGASLTRKACLFAVPTMRESHME